MRQAATTTKADRSAQMARIKSRNTNPELRVRRALHKAGLRYKLHDRSLPGTPDLTFSKDRIAVFVNGCFWHQHPEPTCKLARMPKSRLDFWAPKLEANRRRDERTHHELKLLGWFVVDVWECQINEANLATLADDLKALKASRFVPSSIST